ncbi:hypothetical protein [Corynebacterium glyciniphilum]|uniref:hypothetical protein n=1 Tax=Corynebacterium glyciniphilum TaxID=1404244 RepID=UPI0026564462|nr:hypothetical protein [Corynebacterium glyciniphilum]MDN6706405.1 hypothetical protein [Corynebacterium glyciniphilum]
MIKYWGATSKVVESLVNARLWDREHDGFKFRSWSDYNPTKAQSEAKRAAEAERKRHAREAKAKKRAGEDADDSERPTGQDEMSERTPSEPSALSRPVPARPGPSPIKETPCSPPEGDAPQGELIAAPAKPSKKSKRGSSLPEDWIPSPELRARVSEKCPDINQRWHFTKFQNYWLSKPGAAGRKLDWDRTYTNWMLQEQEKATRGGSGAAPQQSNRPASFADMDEPSQHQMLDATVIDVTAKELNE